MFSLPFHLYNSSSFFPVFSHVHCFLMLTLLSLGKVTIETTGKLLSIRQSLSLSVRQFMQFIKLSLWRGGHGSRTLQHFQQLFSYPNPPNRIWKASNVAWDLDCLIPLRCYINKWLLRDVGEVPESINNISKSYSFELEKKSKRIIEEKLHFKNKLLEY